MEFDNYVFTESIGHKLAEASRLVSTRLSQRFRENNYPVTFEQWIILVRLWVQDGQTQHELCIKTKKDNPSVSRLIDNMIKRGLVKRVPHPTDRRTNLIFLTEEAKELEHDLNGQAYKNVKQATKDIDKQEVDICIRVLNQIIKNLE